MFRSVLVLLMAVATFGTVSSLRAEGELVIADFNTGDKPNNLGGDLGSWDSNPADETQGAQMTFVSDDALGNPDGYSVHLEYDVDSPNPAFNGFWMKLNGFDATGYKTLNFYLKGDRKMGFTKRVKVELKDKSGRPSPYVIYGITGEWQQISVPLERFKKISDWTNVDEFVLVLDDITASKKSGAVFLDQVTLSRE